MAKQNWERNASLVHEQLRTPGQRGGTLGNRPTRNLAAKLIKAVRKRTGKTGHAAKLAAKVRSSHFSSHLLNKLANRSGTSVRFKGSSTGRVGYK